MNNWYFALYKSRRSNNWIAMAKREPFVNGDPFQEPGDLWFEIDPDYRFAIRKLKSEVSALGDAA